MTTPSLSGSPFVRVAITLMLVAVLGGCTTIKGWFGRGDKAGKPTEPAELADFEPVTSVIRLWSTSAGKGEKRIGARQAPVIADGRVYAAAIEGGVRAFDLQTGALVWHHDTELRLSGGPGAGEGLVVAGGLDGDVLALEATTGVEKWRAKVSNEVIAAPVIGAGMVFVRSNDGRLTAFDAATGERRWFWQQDVPPLSVRGHASVVLGPGYVFVGNDNGTVSALAMADGRPLWERTVAEQEGRSELERMADVDGTPVLDGAILYASSYKRQTVAIDAPTGRPLWASTEGGPGRLGNAADRLIVSDAGGAVLALDKATGSALWKQDALARRDLSAPAVHGDYAVVGDYDGYLHWLRLDTGAFAARTRVGRVPVRGAPVVADGILVVQNVEGELTAFRLGQ